MQCNQFVEVPARIVRLRSELFETKDSICFERAHIVTRVYQQTEGQPNVLRRAKALQAVFTKMPIFIREGEQLVGQRATQLGARAVYPEYHLNGLTAETTPPEIWEYWHGRTLGDEVHNAYPEQLRRAERELAAGYCTGADSGFGHVIVDYEKVLRRGFKDIAAEFDKTGGCWLMDQQQVTNDNFNNWFPHISPDGKWIAYLAFAPDVAADDHPFYKHVLLRVMPVGGGPARVIAYVYGGQGTINVPSWSPDGTRLAFVSNSAMP